MGADDWPRIRDKGRQPRYLSPGDHINYWARCSGDLPPPSPPAEKATYLDFIRSRHTLQNALALSSYGPTSNAQHDQRYKSDADEQHYERDGVIFEPMPITGKHHCFIPV